MMAALMAAAMWLHLATILGAPVSTTHSIIGGVIGAGVAAAGTGIVHWPMIARSSRAGSRRRSWAA
jgi:inorganic phosphate transporter, PiT family